MRSLLYLVVVLEVSSHTCALARPNPPRTPLHSLPPRLLPLPLPPPPHTHHPPPSRPHAQLFDGAQTVMSGVVAGAGKQHHGSVVNLIAYWLVAVSVCACVCVCVWWWCVGGGRAGGLGGGERVGGWVSR